MKVPVSGPDQGMSMVIPKKNLCTILTPYIKFKVQRTLKSFLSRVAFWGILEVHDHGMKSRLKYEYVNLHEKNLTNFSFLYWVLRCKEFPSSYCLDWGCGVQWRFMIGVWHLRLGLNIFRRVCSKFQLPTLSLNVQRTLMSLLSCLGLKIPLVILDWGSKSLFGYEYNQLHQKNLYTKFLLPTL